MSNRDTTGGQEWQSGGGFGTGSTWESSTSETWTSTGSGSGSTGDQSTMDKAQSAASQVQDKAGQVADQAQAKAGQVADQATSKVDEGMDKAASGLNQAADMLRQRGQSMGGGTASTVANTAASTLEQGAQFLRENDTDQLIAEVENFVRRKPMESLLIAAGVGFVLSTARR
jgi:ElaB/YqjD/DUF883 family membrane-anchored ribosome-binding protein